MQDSEHTRNDPDEVRLDTVQDCEAVIRLLNPNKEEASVVYNNPVLSADLDESLLNRFHEATGRLMADKSEGEPLVPSRTMSLFWRILLTLATVLTVLIFWYHIKLYNREEEPESEIEKDLTGHQGSASAFGPFPPASTLIVVPAIASTPTTIETYRENLIISVYPDLTTYPRAYLAPIKKGFYEQLSSAFFSVFRSSVETKRTKAKEHSLRVKDGSSRYILPGPEMDPSALISGGYKSPCWPLLRHRSGRLAFNLAPGAKIHSVMVDFDSRIEMRHHMEVYGQTKHHFEKTIYVENSRPDNLTPDWIPLGNAHLWGNGTGTVTIDRDSDLAKLEFVRVLIVFPPNGDALQCITKVRVDGDALSYI